MTIQYKFFMVFVEGGSTPAVKHWRSSYAKKEAARLAAKTGLPTYVLESSCGFQTPKPLPVIFDTTEKAPESYDDEPF